MALFGNIFMAYCRPIEMPHMSLFLEFVIIMPMAWAYESC